jgi:hypothetical protein
LRQAHAVRLAGVRTLPCRSRAGAADGGGLSRCSTQRCRFPVHCVADDPLGTADHSPQSVATGAIWLSLRFPTAINRQGAGSAYCETGSGTAWRPGSVTEVHLCGSVWLDRLIPIVVGLRTIRRCWYGICVTPATIHGSTRLHGSIRAGSFPGRTDRDPSETPLRVDCEYILDPINPLTWWRLYRRVKADAPDLLLLQWWVPYWTPCLTTIAASDQAQYLDQDCVRLPQCRAA